MVTRARLGHVLIPYSACLRTFENLWCVVIQRNSFSIVRTDSGYLFIYFLSDERTIEIANDEPCQCFGTTIKAAQLAGKTTGSIADSTVS